MGMNGIDRRTLIAAAASGGAVLAGGGKSAAVSPARGSPPATPLPALEVAYPADAPTTPTGLAIDALGRALLFMPRFDDETLFSIGLVAPEGSVSPWPDMGINRPDPQRPHDTLFHIPPPACSTPRAGCGCSTPADGGIGTARARRSQTGLLRFRRPGVAHRPDRCRHREGLFAQRPAGSCRGGRPRDGVRHRSGTGRPGRDHRHRSRHRRRETAASASFLDGLVNGVLKLVEGQAITKRGRDRSTSAIQGGANGVALSPDDRRLYWAPLIGRRLYAVATDLLLDGRADDAAVEDGGEKDLTGGLGADAAGRLWLAPQELNAVGVCEADGTVRIVASDPA